MAVTGYVLMQRVFGSRERIDIAQAEFEAFGEAVMCLRHVVDAEEKFAAFMDNYFELEQELLSEALSTLVFPGVGVRSFQSARTLISRRIINLLTSARLYVDSLPQDANKLLSANPTARQKVLHAPSEAYDSLLGYRVMEALRNYSQHEALPVHNWTTSAHRDTDQNSHAILFAVKPALDIQRLENAKAFKASVLNELKALENKLELKPFIREYVQGIGSVHHTLRLEMKGALESWKALIRNARERYSRKFGLERLSGFCAGAINAQGYSVGEPVGLSEALVEYIEHLQSRTHLMTNFASRRVEY